MVFEIRYNDDAATVTCITADEYIRDGEFFEFWLKGDRSPVATLSSSNIASIMMCLE